MQTKDALLPVLNPKPGGERPPKITFTYDHLNRRAGKKVMEMTGGIWQERTHHRYVYNGAALIAEIDATTRQVLRAFAWGATGELLMINDRADTLGPQTYLPVHNATGSVTAMVRAVDNTFAATYEYDPNGNLLRAQGQYAKSNPFTFGGGWMDWETGLINAGSVYYSARLGRFINTVPSGSGDGLPACYGVAPTAGHLSSRTYAQPPARRSTGATGWISVDPDAWTAYEKARAAYEEAWYLSNEEQSHNPREEPPEENSADEFVADFLAWASWQHFTGTHGSFDTGLSNVYLAGRIDFGNGSFIEFYDDGSLTMTNTLGSTLAIDADGTITVNLSPTQLASFSADGLIVNSGGPMTYKELMKQFSKNDTPLNPSIPITKEAFNNLLNTNADIKKTLAATAKNQTTMIGYDLMRRESGLVIAMDKAGGIHVSTLVYGPWELVGSADAASVSFANGIKWAESNGWTVIAGVHSHPNDNLFYASNRDRVVHDFHNFWGVVIQQGDPSSGILIDPSNGKTNTIKFKK